MLHRWIVLIRRRNLEQRSWCLWKVYFTIYPPFKLTSTLCLLHGLIWSQNHPSDRKMHFAECVCYRPITERQRFGVQREKLYCNYAKVDHELSDGIPTVIANLCAGYIVFLASTEFKICVFRRSPTFKSMKFATSFRFGRTFSYKVSESSSHFDEWRMGSFSMRACSFIRHSHSFYQTQRIIGFCDSSDSGGNNRQHETHDFDL